VKHLKAMLFHPLIRHLQIHKGLVSTKGLWTLGLKGSWRDMLLPSNVLLFIHIELHHKSH